jgi:hypothetical protein
MIIRQWLETARGRVIGHFPPGRRSPLTPLEQTLADMHTYARPHGSAIENEFRRRYLGEFGPMRDPFGNLHVKIGDDSRVLFSCHTDTVADGAGRQTVYIDTDDRLRLSRRSRQVKGACLGADDTVGVFLMREMIKAGIPGYYIFHYGEEAGCIGSRDLADDRAEWLRSSFDMAVAFDRKDTGDVITHQCGWRTASDKFATALAHQLNMTDRRLLYLPCDTGLYTDTNSYAELIPECTNISIGYSSAHGVHESVDVAHVLRLRQALLMVDWDHLPIDREPVSEWTDEWIDTEEDLTAPVISSSMFTRIPDREIDSLIDGLPGDPDDDRISADVDQDLRQSRGRGLHDIIFLCEACGLEYFLMESDAPRRQAFCSPECQQFAETTGARRS